MKLRFLLLASAIWVMVSPAYGQLPFTNGSKGYLIGPGDVIAVKALGEKDFDIEGLTVDEDGRVQIPFVDQPVAASCKTERELQSDVIKLWSKYLKNPQVSLRVTARNSRPPVSVIGEVSKQDQFVPQRRVSLLEVLSAAGGPTSKNGGMVQLIRTRPPICADPETMAEWKKETASGLGISTRIYSLAAVAQGSAEANPEILPGDIINVPKAAPFYVTGEVLKAGEFDLPAGGLPLTQAIAMASGKSREAKTKDVKIYRRKPGSPQPEVLVADLDAIKNGRQKDVMLEPYDIVEVGKQGETFGSFMTKLLTGIPNRIPIPIP
jgi:protein involved in polysaccharide export with SLBB domain